MNTLHACILVLLLIVVQAASVTGDIVVFHQDSPESADLVFDHLADITRADHRHQQADDSAAGADDPATPDCHSCHCHGTHFSLPPQRPLDMQSVAPSDPLPRYLAQRPDGYHSPLFRPPIV